MAGLGIKKFVSGEILTADEVNGYLMDQAVCVFDTTSARDTAFTGAGSPTLSEGRVCYIKATNKVQYYDGSSWVDSEQFSVSQNSQVSPGILQLDRLVSGTPAQIIVCNSSGVPTYVTLSGDATISNAGVLTVGGNAVALGADTTGNYIATIAGTTNQITVTGSGGETAAVTLALPQDIHTAANPAFAGLTADAVQIGITTANEIDTTVGNLVLDSTGGTVTVDDILSVSGSAVISGAASVAGLLTAANNLSVTGSAAVSTNLSVSGSAVVSGAASVAGLFTAAGNVAVSGSVSVAGNVVGHAIPESSSALSSSVDGRILKISTGLTLNSSASVGWVNGTQFTVINTSGGALTITKGTGTTFLAAPTTAGGDVKLRANYSTATFICESTSASTANWYVIGDLTSV